MNSKRTIRAAIMASLMLIVLLFANSSFALAFAAEPIGSGALHILGVGLAADPSHQNAPMVMDRRDEIKNVTDQVAVDIPVRAGQISGGRTPDRLRASRT